MIPPVVQPGDVFQLVRMPNAAGTAGKSIRIVSVSGGLTQFEWVDLQPYSVNLDRLDGTAAQQRTAMGSPHDEVSAGCIIGDSTMAAFSGQAAVSTFLVTAADIAYGSSVTSLAVAGHTIAQQQAAWTADTNKATYDWIIVCVGLNDAVLYAESAATAMARYQTLINTINAGKKATAKVIIATMTPAKARFIDLEGPTNGATAYAKWLAMNTAIMTTVTGVDYRIDTHTAAMNDGSGNLRYKYDINDGIHENDLARKEVIAKHFRAVLQTIGCLQKTSSLADYVPITEGQLVEILEQPAIAIYRDIVTTLLLRGAATGISVEAGNDLSGFYVYAGETVFYTKNGAGSVSAADFAIVIDQVTKAIKLKSSLVSIPSASTTLTVNGQMTFDRVSNTEVRLKLRGDDGVTRETTLTLS